MQSARLAYNGDVSGGLDDVKIYHFEVGTYGDGDFLEKLKPKLEDIVKKYSESNFDLFQPFFCDCRNQDFEVQKEIHTKLLVQSASVKIQDLCSKYKITNSKDLFELIDLQQYLQDNLLSRTLFQYEEVILQKVIEWRRLQEEVDDTRTSKDGAISQRDMTSSDIARMKQQIGVDNFSILFTRRGFENQFMDEYRHVYKQLYLGVSKGDIQNDGFLYITLYMQ